MSKKQINSSKDKNLITKEQKEAIKKTKRMQKIKVLASKEQLRSAKLSKREDSIFSKKKQIKINLKSKIKEVKNVTKLNKTPKGNRELKNTQDGSVIELRAVKKQYTSKTRIFDAINNIDLSIKKGEFIAILGPSGSGKTTLLNIISGLDRTTYGDVIVNNKNLSSLTDRELTIFRKNNIGFIFQSYNLLPSLNVQDNVEVGRSLQKDNNKRMNTQELLNILGIGDQAKKRTYELSGGQQQRVSIARALSKNPLLLICDEPTGALDQKSSDDVVKLFRKINAKYKTTIILVTHSSTVSKVADRVIHVVDGTIKEIIVQKGKQQNKAKV